MLNQAIGGVEQGPVGGLLRANALGQANAAERQRGINELLGSDPRKNFKIFDAFVKTTNRLAKDNLDKDVLIDFVLKEIESKANTQQAINEKIQGLYAKLAQPLPSQPQVEYTAGESVANLVGALTGQQGIMMATQAEATARRDQQFKEALANDQLQRGITERQLGREERSLDLARGEQSQLEMMRLQQIGALSAEDRQNERRDYEYDRSRADALDDREFGIRYDEMRRRWDQDDEIMRQKLAIGTQQYLESLPMGKSKIAQIKLGIAADALEAGNIDVAQKIFNELEIPLDPEVWEMLRIAYIERKAEAAALQNARQSSSQRLSEKDLLAYRTHLNNLVAKGEMTKEEADSQYESMKEGFAPMDPFGPGASLSGDIGRGITGRNPLPQASAGQQSSGQAQATAFEGLPDQYKNSVYNYMTVLHNNQARGAGQGIAGRANSSAQAALDMQKAYNDMMVSIRRSLPKNVLARFDGDLAAYRLKLSEMQAELTSTPNVPAMKTVRDGLLRGIESFKKMFRDRWGFVPL